MRSKEERRTIYVYGHRPSDHVEEFKDKEGTIEYLQDDLPNDNNFRYRTKYTHQPIDSIIFSFEGELLAELVVGEVVPPTRDDLLRYNKTKTVYLIDEIRIFRNKTYHPKDFGIIYHQSGSSVSNEQYHQIIDTVEGFDDIINRNEKTSEFEESESDALDESAPDFEDKIISEEIEDDSKYYPDYLKKQQRQGVVGRQAEDLVLWGEQDRLRESGLDDLADQVEYVGDQPNYGYDILSYETTGEARQIAVKAVRSDGDRKLFYLTANELEKSQTLANYYLYLVSDLTSDQPKILMIQDPELEDEDQFSLEVVNYRVSVREAWD